MLYCIDMNIRTVCLKLILLVGIASTPQLALATANLEVSGWIPYWRVAEGTKDAKKHLNKLDTIHPFAFTVKQDGSLSDQAGLSKNSWKSLFKSARSKNVEIIPTIMWSDGVNIHRVLSDDELRQNHIDQIVKMVRKSKYAGVDIDYEAKKAETKDYFSLFLKELKNKLNDKELICTIEARTPPESLYSTIPTTLQYANDYVAIGTHCDRVQLMAYDQGRADIKLNSTKNGSPYIPVADVDWVRKVVTLALQSIPKEKLILGVPTYGYEYEVMVSPNWYQNYRRLWSFNPPYAADIAKKYNLKPSRNRAGEMSLSYIATSSAIQLPNWTIAPTETPSGNTVAAKALNYANTTGQTMFFNLLWWSDAGGIEDKVKLAKELDLRGVAIFKIDGAADPDLWKIFEN